MLLRPFITPVFVFYIHVTNAQDSLRQIPNSYFKTVTAKASRLQQKLNTNATKMVSQMKKQEESMNEKLLMIDSLKAKKIFGNIEKNYNDFEKRVKK